MSNRRVSSSPILDQAFSASHRYMHNWNAAKNLQVRKVWLCPKILLVRGVVMDTLGRAPIDEIHNCNCCLCPVDVGHVLLLQHGVGHLKNCAILPLSNTVLLWCVPAREFSANPFSSRKALNSVEKYSWPPSDRKHRILRFVSFSTRIFNLRKWEKTSLFDFIGHIQVCCE